MPYAAMTLDIDWAPDWCIQMCAEILIKNNCKATFFVTHKSPILKYLEKEPLFELGIHPNFLQNSTHGNTVESVLNHCMEIVPQAVSMRTHALMMSTPIMATVGDKYKQIKTDVSALFFGQEGLAPQDDFFGIDKRKLTRLPFCWEDDVNAEHPQKNWGAPTKLDGKYLNIYSFHPVLIALNITSCSTYLTLKQSLNGKPLQECTESDFPTETSAKGCLNFFKNISKLISEEGSFTIDEITTKHQSQKA